MSNIIKDQEVVFCPICKRSMKQLTHKHLKKHDLTTEEFKIQFPDCYLMHPELEKRIKKARADAKKKKEKIPVEKPCWNFENCKNKMMVNINVGYQNVTCDECRSKNLFHPNMQKHKQRLSEQAKKMNQDPDIKIKRKKTWDERTEEDKEETKKKRDNTMTERFGPDWPITQAKKSQDTLESINDVRTPLEVKKYKEQAQETLFIRTGYINAMDDPKNVKKVFDQRNQDKITKKTIETNQKTRGTDWPMSDPTVVEKAKKTRYSNQENHVLKYLEEIGFTITGNYENAHHKTTFKHTGGCGYEWETNWNQLWNSAVVGNPCPNCKPKNTNTKITQNNIQKFIESLGFKPLVDNRVFLGDRRELDFIIDEIKVNIEYCGLHWHSHEMLKDTRKKINDVRTYHLTKLEICEEKGYRLITIFENEWIKKKDIVKGRIKQILNKSDATRIHARECSIHEITSKTKTEFLNTFHIQGSNDISSLAYGAFSKNDELIAIMTFGRPRGFKKKSKTEWEMKRFCLNFNYHSPGIANKLLSHFKNNNNWDYIISYADRRWSNGDLYEKLGFTLENKGFPAPWYFDNNSTKLYHRSKVWKTAEDIETGLTQEQLAVKKGLKVIYDCGNLKYRLVNK